MFINKETTYLLTLRNNLTDLHHHHHHHHHYYHYHYSRCAEIQPTVFQDWAWFGSWCWCPHFFSRTCRRFVVIRRRRLLGAAARHSRPPRFFYPHSSGFAVARVAWIIHDRWASDQAPLINEQSLSQNAIALARPYVHWPNWLLIVAVSAAATAAAHNNQQHMRLHLTTQ